MAEQFVMSEQSVCSATVFVLPSNNVRDQMQLINSEAISNKYYECVSVFLPWVSWRKIASLNGFWFSLNLLSETFLIVRIIQRDVIINLLRSSCKAPVILVILLVTLEFFSTDFLKNLRYKI